MTNWEQIKKAEKDDQSLVAGVTAGLPALIATQKLFRKGASIGLEPDVPLDDAVRRLADAGSRRLEAMLGAALAAVVAVGREHDIDAESALASWTRRYKDRFRRMEQLAADDGVDLASAPAEQVRALWSVPALRPDRPSSGVHIADGRAKSASSCNENGPTGPWAPARDGLTPEQRGDAWGRFGCGPTRSRRCGRRRAL